AANSWSTHCKALALLLSCINRDPTCRVNLCLDCFHVKMVGLLRLQFFCPTIRNHSQRFWETFKKANLLERREKLLFEITFKKKNKRYQRCPFLASFTKCGSTRWL